MMKAIAKQILKWNHAYNKIPEPRRFFTFFAMALPGVICTGFVDSWLWDLGIIYLLVLLIQRWAFVKGHLVKYIDKDTTNG